jgi:hypothetical protein
MIPWASLTLRHTSTICSPFSRRIITLNFSIIPIVFHRFFTWLALGDAHVRFSLILVRNASAVEEKTKWVMYITLTKWIHTHDWWRNSDVTYCRLLQKINVTTDCLCQIAGNWKLSSKFNKRNHGSSIPDRGTANIIVYIRKVV